MVDSQADHTITLEELSDRLLEFAARVGKVVDALPDTRLGSKDGGLGSVRSRTNDPQHVQPLVLGLNSDHTQTIRFGGTQRQPDHEGTIRSQNASGH